MCIRNSHDVEDSNPSNQVYINGAEQTDWFVGKFTSVTKDDAVLAWEPIGNRPWNVPVGPAYIQYGLVVLPSQSCGRILEMCISDRLQSMDSKLSVGIVLS